MRPIAIVPAYDAAPLIGDVVDQLMQLCPDAWGPGSVLVIDDGSNDDTAAIARAAGADVLVHHHNMGKGAALRTGMRAAWQRGFDVAITIDGDGQHPPDEALRMHACHHDAAALVIGVRDLVGAGAPRPNQLSNSFSNRVLSAFTGAELLDTQCGLRRYPIAATLALGGHEDGYGYEAEILMRAIAAGIAIEHESIRVLYPPNRISHFDAVRDPTKIVARVVRTALETRLGSLRKVIGLRSR